MNYKKLLFITFLSFGFLLLLGNKQVYSQNANKQEINESIYEHWFYAIDKFQASAGVNKEDFGMFSRFSEKQMDSLSRDFMKAIGTGKVTLANAKDYEDVLVKGIGILYGKFLQVKAMYPSSIDEYRNYRAPMLSQICDSACTNIDFSTGDLTGWYAYYAENHSSTATSSITNITGGLAGAVTHAANDVATSTTYYNAGSVGPNPSPDYQVNITSGTRGDAIVPSIPVVSPFGGNYSVMLGDSSWDNFGVAILSQTFKVTPSNANFTYQYAVFLANPTGHNYYQQPFFKVAVLDGAGDTIPFCGEYTVVSGNGTHNFDSLIYTTYYPLHPINPVQFTVFYKNWTKVNVPLKHYIGQCVTVVFEVGDCALGGHFGYAYVDASCSPLTILSSSYVFCGQDSLTLTGPGGEEKYKWTGPTNGIISNDTSQNVTIDSAGTYTVVTTPFTGATCNDTLTVTIGKKPGPPPHPNFTADTGCVGMETSFFNTSVPLAGSKFYWDFYNDGTYEDSNIVNPTWRYNQTGTYQVKLQQFYNGCGADTIITVVIDSISNSAFIADTVCFNDTTQFTNTSTGGVTYYWNFGDPPTGVNNTSLNVNPYHVFSAPGTYTVSLIAKHPDWCNDTVKKNVVVLALPIPKITGTDSICSGTSAILTASGGTSYVWNTGATSSSITVNPLINTTYTVTVSNGKCSADTTYKLHVRPIGTGAITGNGSVCFGSNIVLTASGGGTYLWNTGATTSSITITANSFSDTAYSVVIGNGDSCTTIHKRINIDSISGFACCNDTISAGNSVILVGSGSTSYYWTPDVGLSCDTCPDPTVSPTVTTTYTLVSLTDAGCRANSLVTVYVDIPCRDFFVPNVFTPNGDDVNDTYLIKAEFMSMYVIDIYNRWGKKVFHSTDPSAPWDGTIKGAQAAAGVYYYIIKATCQNGNSIDKEGFLQLIRE